jgi:8-oxo-dGTP pyrophosphatase MutT (NUDIX family)
MKNFPIKDESGKEYWISRAVTVVILVIAEDDDCDPVILAIQRSENTPDPEYVGCWCLPCGYVDYDETIAEAFHDVYLNKENANIASIYIVNKLKEKLK